MLAICVAEPATIEGEGKVYLFVMINVLPNLGSLTSYKRLREKAKNCTKRIAEKNSVYDMERYGASSREGLGKRQSGRYPLVD